MSGARDQNPMWPDGRVTRKCVSCRSTTRMLVCERCGRTTLPMVAYNLSDAMITPADRYGLTQREANVMELIATGVTYAMVGKELGIASSTVKATLAHVRMKMGASSRFEATRMWWEARAA
jgi:DNA-binding CsgD family transcriptional regulator